MNVLQIGGMARQNSGGGLIRYFFNLVRELPKYGVNSFGLITGNAAAFGIDSKSIESVSSENASILTRSFLLSQGARRKLPVVELVVSHFAPFTLPVLPQMGRKPLVVHFHGPWALESEIEGDSKLKVLAKDAIERLVYRRATSFIVLSNAFAAILNTSYGVDRGRIHVISGGVQVSRFAGVPGRLEARKRLNWPTDGKIVLAVRRLKRSKGISNLIDAAEAISAKRSDTHVFIAGEGDLYDDLARKISNGRLSKVVRLVGFIPEAELPLAYAAADIVIVPTIAYEGFGLVVLEALAAGTPALLTPVDGLPEVVKEFDGKLFTRGSTAQDLAEAICASLEDPDALPSANACREYANRFDWNEIARQVSEVYRAAL